MAQKPNPLSGLPLLIVHDDTSILSFMTAALSLHKRPYEIALTGDQALAILVTTHVQAVLLDLRLPDRNGVDVLREIVKHPGHPPVVLISGASITICLDAGRQGAASYLEKPARIPEVLAALYHLSDFPSGTVDYQNIDHHGTGPITSTAVVGRLAEVVLRASLESSDFKHGRGLATVANTGYGTMRHWCRTVSISGRAFVRFARGFWATRHALRSARAPIELLDCIGIESTGRILDPS